MLIYFVQNFFLVCLFEDLCAIDRCILMLIFPCYLLKLLMVQTSGAMPFTTSVPTGISSCIPSPSHNRILNNNIEQQTFFPNKNFTNYTCVAQPVKPVPPMFKSSIAFGVGLVSSLINFCSIVIRL